MKKEISLDQRQMTYILINVLYVKLLFTFPRGVVSNAGNAAWIEMLYVSLIAFIIFFITTKTYKTVGNMNVIQLAEELGGKVFKGITGILISVTLFLNLARTMRSFPEMVKIVLLPNTPTEVILIVFALVVGIAAFMGLGSIARIHSLYIPIIMVIVAIFLLMLYPDIRVNNVFPILGKGTYNLFVKGLDGLILFSDLIVLNILLPNLKNTTDAKKAGYRSITICGISAILITLIYCMVYPFPSSQIFLVPIYQMTRLVGIGEFFRRFEAFFEFIWSLSIFLYSSLYINVMCKVWKDSFDLQFETPIIFSMITITTILSFGMGDMKEIYSRWYLNLFIMFVTIVLPVIYVYLYKFKRKKL